MKRVLFPVISLVILISQNAYATHAYRSENCVSTTHNLNYKGNYPVGGMYGISLAGDENDVTALPLFDASETGNTLEDAEVIFLEATSTIIRPEVTTNDCWFEHTEWASKKEIGISLISDEASQKLGLKKGDVITFICEESTDYPNGNECE